MICDAVTGFPLIFEIYTGENQDDASLFEDRDHAHNICGSRKRCSPISKMER